MTNVIDFESKRNKKLEQEWEECNKRLEILTGVIKRQDGRKFILQGVQPTFKIYEDDQIRDLNPFCYVVNNDLIIQGYTPYGSIPLDDNFFMNRQRMLSEIGWKKIREERAEYREGNTPCVVFYGKN